MCVFFSLCLLFYSNSGLQNLVVCVGLTWISDIVEDDDLSAVVSQQKRGRVDRCRSTLVTAYYNISSKAVRTTDRYTLTLGSNCPAKISSVEGAGVVISNSGSGAKIGFFKIIFSAIYIYYFITFIFEFCVLKFEFLRRTKYFIYNLLLFLRSSTMHMPFKF